MSSDNQSNATNPGNVSLIDTEKPHIAAKGNASHIDPSLFNAQLEYESRKENWRWRQSFYSGASRLFGRSTPGYGTVSTFDDDDVDNLNEVLNDMGLLAVQTGESLSSSPKLVPSVGELNLESDSKLGVSIGISSSMPLKKDTPDGSKPVHSNDSQGSSLTPTKTASASLISTVSRTGSILSSIWSKTFKTKSKSADPIPKRDSEEEDSSQSEHSCEYLIE